MALKLNNLATSRLAANITADATVLTVTAGHGGRFPDLAEPDDWFPLALVNDLAETEFVRCIGRAGDVLTVERAAEGSVARAYSAGDVVELRLTVAALTALRDEAP